MLLQLLRIACEKIITFLDVKQHAKLSRFAGKINPVASTLWPHHADLDVSDGDAFDFFVSNRQNRPTSTSYWNWWMDFS